MTARSDYMRNAGALLLISCTAAFASAGPKSLKDENLVFMPPTGFKVGFDSSQTNNLMTEYVPEAQTVNDWSEMVTVQVYRHATVEPAAFFQGVGGKYQDACSGTEAVGGGIHTGDSNGYVVSMLFLKCPLNPSTKKPETTIFRAIKGIDALYLVQHAWRSAPTNDQVSKAMQSLSRVIACDARTKNHPCPPIEAQAAPD